MHSTALTTAVALLAAVSGAAAAPNTCGAAPAGAANAPVLQQPADIQTAEACRAACNANPSCKSFLFGLDTAIQCKLFGVEASAIPKQESANLLAYDKACTSVPSVKPAAENPAGRDAGKHANGKLVTRNTCGGAPAGKTNVKPLSAPANVETQQACLAKCKAEPNCKSFEFGTVNGKKTCRLFSVPAAQAPAPQQGESLNAFDVGCSL
ncbi:hypothetical protein VTN00DRAFT_3045 [Thermoascus crustaceus]|uniref:uncharacterized protein n=1 Tax=Thermoascus crustaceus TaxID=5088 RepID=UPI0037427021